MIHQVAGFIRWKLEQDDGVNLMAGIVSDANSRELMEWLAEASENMNDDTFHRVHSFQAVIALDDHLEITGLYREMAEEQEKGDQAIADEEQSIRYGARMPL